MIYYTITMLFCFVSSIWSFLSFLLVFSAIIFFPLFFHIIITNTFYIKNLIISKKYPKILYRVSGVRRYLSNMPHGQFLNGRRESSQLRKTEPTYSWSWQSNVDIIVLRVSRPFDLSLQVSLSMSTTIYLSG